MWAREQSKFIRAENPNGVASLVFKVRLAFVNFLVTTVPCSLERIASHLHDVDS